MQQWQLVIDAARTSTGLHDQRFCAFGQRTKSVDHFSVCAIQKLLPMRAHRGPTDCRIAGRVGALSACLFFDAAKLLVQSIPDVDMFLNSGLTFR